jgi:hypothetical protein
MLLHDALWLNIAVKFATYVASKQAVALINKNIRYGNWIVAGIKRYQYDSVLTMF